MEFTPGRFREAVEHQLKISSPAMQGAITHMLPQLDELNAAMAASNQQRSLELGMKIAEGINKGLDLHRTSTGGKQAYEMESGETFMENIMAAVTHDPHPKGSGFGPTEPPNLSHEDKLRAAARCEVANRHRPSGPGRF